MFGRRKKQTDEGPLLTVRSVDGSLKDKKISKLQRKAFPSSDLLPPPAMKILGKRGMASHLSFYDGDRLAGVAQIIENGKMVYVVSLAVDEKRKSDAYGTAVLKELARLAEGRPLVLETLASDPEARNNRKREERLDFFERNGFTDTGYNMVDGKTVYRLLSSKGRDFDRADLFRLLHRFTLGFYQAEIVRHW